MTSSESLSSAGVNRRDAGEGRSSLRERTAGTDDESGITVAVERWAIPDRHPGAHDRLRTEPRSRRRVGREAALLETTLELASEERDAAERGGDA